MEMMGSFRVSPTYTVAALPSAATAVRSYGTTTDGTANRPSPSAVTIAVFPAFTFAAGLVFLRFSGLPLRAVKRRARDLVPDLAADVDAVDAGLSARRHEGEH